ncbi:MAG: hypothetical protein ACJAWV_002696 [Flammeovirgaceae bacterium]|jgi:hypothetical protein
MKKKIAIPSPCSQKWNEMNSTNSFDSRFCQSCQKNVVDFTQKSDSEIARTLKKEKNLCGRFRISQLDREYTIPTERSSWVISSAIATLLALQTACTELEITHEVVLKETVLVDFVVNKECSGKEMQN